MPAQSTYTPIATYTSTGSTAQFLFTSIPQTYTDLVLVFYARSTYAITNHQVYMQLNGASTNYSNTTMLSDGASATSSRTTGQTGIYPGGLPGASSTAGIFGAQWMQIMNYTNTTTFKTVTTRTSSDTNGAGNTQYSAGLWRSTAAITQIVVQNVDGTTWVSGSMATLYGITAA